MLVTKDSHLGEKLLFHQKSGYLVILSLYPSWSCHLTSVTASKEAECLSSRSMDRMWFFLQAIWRGVKPFWEHRENSSQLVYT